MTRAHYFISILPMPPGLVVPHPAHAAFVICIAPMAWTGTVTEIFPAFSKVSVSGNVSPGGKRFLQSDQHHMVAAGLEHDRSAGWNGQAAGEFAHLHHAVDDLHFVNLQLVGNVR